MLGAQNILNYRKVFWMKLLLDKNLPVKLKYRFADRGFEIFTTKDMRWLGKQNGELLQLMLQYDFTTLITIDSNLPYQQNFKNYPIQVVSLVSFDNSYVTIMEFFDAIVDAVNEYSVGLKLVTHPSYKL